MKLVYTCLLTLILFLVSTKSAHALVVIVPTILVSIVKIVVLIIGIITTPVVGLSALYASLNKKPLVKGLLIGILVLIVLGVAISLILKIVNPSRPLY